MKKILITILTIANITIGFSQQSYKAGEYLKYRMHYGVVNAGYASLEVENTIYDKKPHYHVKGKGWSVGAFKWFFPVKDDYQSYIDKETGMPSKAIRKINEDGHIKDLEMIFEKDSVKTIDHENHKTYKVAAKNVQDMISAFYYLRNHITNDLPVNRYVSIPMYFDDEIYPFKLKKLREEVISTEFGKINCHVFRPYVQSGRVFKQQESLTLWVSADGNKIPVRIQAELRVGALKADLDAYKGLSYPLKFIINK